MDHILRILTTLQLIQTGRANVNSLARQFSTSRRTILRDIEKLREHGLPIHFDRERKTYSFTSGFYLPATHFTTEETLALLVLCYDINEKFPFFSAVGSASLKLLGLLPDELREYAESTGPGIKVILEKLVEPVPQMKTNFDHIVEAYRSHRAVRILYKSPADPEEIQTLLSPYRIVFLGRTWYIIGRSSVHRETRTFNLGRILNLENTEHEYNVPLGFHLKSYLRNAWNMIPEPGPDSEVIVRFSPKVAQNVKEIHWHRTQRILPRSDGSIDFHVTVSGLNEISWWILGYGKEAEVLQPEPLRKIIQEHARAMLETYSAPGKESI